ncbi:hypothetical protein SARC_01595 [Sphaeroforma arctica JP610]|uniref:Uncharacterized protein n=1 Tax=Sphaeroforma arctica JP610 TaxID=667725 RepID=A0A0L0GDE6_9EUKA|nr:hypothetical protein SARC_01595 [Sphaeroforma arctica JP610]KNC86273.1 hypothetical protein SARC_01595 [Sphaeroforma arctica JP610]|eukprot:XP_014160175.1 hypothetical protein SARC_01595 [Sphaeroforma arctica JP610]
MFQPYGVLQGLCSLSSNAPTAVILLTNISIAQTTIPVCSGHGELSAQDICVCEIGYSITSDGLGCTAEGDDDADHDHNHDHEEECSGYGHMHDGECHCSAGYSSVNSNGTACELILEPEYFMDMLIEKYFNTTTNRIYADGIDKLIDSLGTATTVAADDKSCSGNGHWDNTECHCDSGYTLSEDGRQCTASSRRRQTTEEVVTPCLNGQSLFKLYQIDMDEGATELQFSANFSPAIVQMIESGACTVSTVATDDTDSTDAPSKGQAYLYAMVSVFIISLTSLGGVMVIPAVLKAPKTAKWVLMALVALAVGVLLGDAVLHLLPIALGVHVHSDDGGLVVLSGNEVVYRTITVCAGLFFFVVLEGILDGAGLGQHGHSHEGISPEDMVDLGMKMQEEELITDAGLESGHTHETTHEPATSGNDSDSSDLSDRVKVTNTIDGDRIQIEKDVKPIGGADGYDSVKINKDTDEKVDILNIYYITR